MSTFHSLRIGWTAAILFSVILRAECRAQAPWAVPVRYESATPPRVMVPSYPLAPVAPYSTFYPAPIQSCPPMANNQSPGTTNVDQRFSAEQKLSIVKQHLLDGVPVTEVCRRNGIRPDDYYRWQSQLFAGGAIALSQNSTNSDDSKDNHTVEKLEDKLEAKNEVISDLLEEWLRQKSLQAKQQP